MNYYRYFVCSLLLLFATLPAYSQSYGANSPYSRFGVGNLNEQAQGFNKGMSGVSLGWRDGKIINKQNPASYSAIDSLSFIFDLGMTFQNVNFKSGNNNINAASTSLDYVSGAFRLCPGLGLAFGFQPYSTIGYEFSENKFLSEDFDSGYEMTYTNTYSGNGGIHEAFVGLGWNPFAGLSIGANIGFLWGNYDQLVYQTFYEDGSSSTSSNGLNRQISADIRTYKLDIGIQYPLRINKNNILTIGATYSMGHKLKSEAVCHNYISGGDTTSTTLQNAFSLPQSYSAGFSWQHSNNLKIGADVHYQQWSTCNVPQIINNQFVSNSSNYKDRVKVIVGGEYTPDRLSNNYFKRICYRFGGSYATPYYKIDGATGPQETGLTAGVGLPLSKQQNSNSLLNVSLQWLNVSAASASLIKENYFRLSIGITFNERWFMKWKIQ